VGTRAFQPTKANTWSDKHPVHLSKLIVEVLSINTTTKIWRGQGEDEIKISKCHGRSRKEIWTIDVDLMTEHYGTLG